MEFKTILYEVGDDHVGTITINRPDKMNTFTREMIDEFAELWKIITADDNVKAVVLRAAECRAFSTGAYVTTNQTDTELFSPYLSGEDPGVGLSPKTNHCWKPVITAVHGMCAGGAFYWLNESDIIICSEDAEFFDPHVTYGLTAALEPIGALARVPLGDVLRMTLLGNDERITAETALRISLVSEVVPRDQLWDRAHQLAALIAQKPADAVQGSVRAIWEALDVGRTAALRMAFKYCQITMMNGTSATVNPRDVMGKAKTFFRR